MRFLRPIKYVIEKKRHIKHIVWNGTLGTYGTFSLSAQTLIKDLNNQSPPKTQAAITCPDLPYLLNKMNRAKIIENLSMRREITLEKATNIVDLLYLAKEESIKSPTEENRRKLNEIASKFPNLTHPKAAHLKEPKVINKQEKWIPKSPLDKIQTFEKLGGITGGLRTHDTSQVSSEKSYYLFGQLAELEQALIRYNLFAKG